MDAAGYGRAHDLRYVVLRYFNVAGADPRDGSGDRPARDPSHQVAVQAALGRGRVLEVFGTDYPPEDGTCIRDYIQVTDLVKAHLIALDHLRTGGESLTCNCGYGQGFSVLEVVDVVKKVSGTDFPVRIAGRRPGDPATIVASAERIKSALGWAPLHDDLEAIVRQALDWERRLHNKPMREKSSAEDLPARRIPVLELRVHGL